MYGKGFLGNMTENLHADCVQSRQAGFVRCCLYSQAAVSGSGEASVRNGAAGIPFFPNSVTAP